ncbi:hypothetical protein FSPOR_5750 [Fusarium sporotrichioides]|uniref:Uncharacterized protein n=1 Tax=Fusarium sporotrichioides TaxID=5514 RepID=A0A395S589_FUSSP|nr:hypothetical protein FSPOR_5750 [Fusarium sporotrichioides]
MRKGVVKNIPTIQGLRSQLGVGITGDKESATFRRVVKEFHQDYKTADGIPGTEFVKWLNSSHREALRRMADEFLETRSWGQRFWPDVGSSIRSTRATTAQIRDVAMNDGIETRHRNGQGTNVAADTFITTNPYQVPSSPIRPSDQISTNSDRAGATSDAPQEQINAALDLSSGNPDSMTEPLAPVARMSEHAVGHGFFFGASDHEAEGGSPRLGSPMLSDQGEPENQPSPDLGVPRPCETVPEGNTGSVRHNSRPSSISAEAARLSTEDRILSLMGGRRIDHGHAATSSPPDHCCDLAAPSDE